MLLERSLLLNNQQYCIGYKCIKMCINLNLVWYNKIWLGFSKSLINYAYQISAMIYNKVQKHYETFTPYK